MKTGVKLLVGGLIGVGAWKALNFATKAVNIGDNIYVEASPKSAKLRGLSLSVLIGIVINNVSGIKLTVTNLFSKLIINLKDGTKEDGGLSSVTPSLTLEKNQFINFDTTFSISYLTLAQKIITGKVQSIDLITYYDFKGQQLSYTTKIDVNKVVEKVKSVIGLSGIKSKSNLNSVSML